MKRPLKIFAIFFVFASLIFGVTFAVLPLPGTIPILMYHFIGSSENAAAEKNYVSRESFARQMKFLHYFGYHPISMDEFYEIETGKRKARGKEIVLTFDDGHFTFDTEAFPILKQYQFPVTLFIISENVKHESGGSMPIATVKKLLSNPWIVIEGHSETHPFLSMMSEDQIRDELVTSKKDLEEIFQVPILYIAYPFGDFDARVMEIAKEAGYRFAFTTSLKKRKDLTEGPYCLTRIKISRTSDNPLVFWLHISGIYEIFKFEKLKFKNWFQEISGAKTRMAIPVGNKSSMPYYRKLPANSVVSD